MTPRRQPLLILLAAAMLSASCTTVIHPPAGPPDPEIVFLVTHGRSSSLILHGGEGDATRWAYGDWRYYALGRKGSSDALAALLWPTRAALGRQTIERAPRTPEDLARRLGIGIDEIFAIEVSRESVMRLESRLQEVFAARLDTLLYNPGPRLEFVEHPRRYSLVSNSNGMVAEWLRELGSEISGLPLLSKWRVAAPPSSPVSRLEKGPWPRSAKPEHDLLIRAAGSTFLSGGR
jgi:hypothetical protein